MVEEDGYFLEVARYVVLNPVRAGIVSVGSRPTKPRRRVRPTDDHAIATAYRTYGYTLAQIADHLGVHYSTVSRRLREL